MENEVKEPAPKYNYISPEEYLEMDRTSDIKHEYYEGLIVAMSGASLNHNIIQANLITEVGPFLKDKCCRVLPSEMRVSTPAHDSYMYPDVLIVCDEPELKDKNFDILLNPSVIFEVLSPSTQNYDKNAKFMRYQRIPSLLEFITINSRNRSITIARKQENESWKFEKVPEESGLHIQTINLTLSFNDIYYNTAL